MLMTHLHKEVWLATENTDLGLKRGWKQNADLKLFDIYTVGNEVVKMVESTGLLKEII